MKKLLLLFATVAMMTACGGNGTNSGAEGNDSTANEGPKTYSIEYDFNSNSGSNWECLDIHTDGKIKADLNVNIEGDKVTITMPLQVKVKGGELKKSLNEGEADFVVENTSAKGKVEFKVADADKVNYDDEYKKLKEGDVLTINITGETTKDVLEKMNNNWGTVALMF